MIVSIISSHVKERGIKLLQEKRGYGLSGIYGYHETLKADIKHVL